MSAMQIRAVKFLILNSFAAGVVAVGLLSAIATHLPGLAVMNFVLLLANIVLMYFNYTAAVE